MPDLRVGVLISASQKTARERRNTRSLGSISMGIPITVSWAATRNATVTSSRACLKQALTKRII
ncbi:hypothetical protein [Ruminococcus sp.]|uniref:hypothetical protein n=1 Tax=Ruminococcus sp. TaxID=41978 RepID=UPI003966D9AF